MPIHNAGNTALLDGVRQRHGSEHLRSIFHDAVSRDEEQAAGLLNDSKIEFTTLFALRPEIIKAGLHQRLNSRNNAALELSEDILSGKMAADRKGRYSNPAVLSWMLHTGYKYDGMNEHYDQVLDACSLLLAKVHQDKESLQPMADMIFSRNRRGAYSYDLVWAFFEASKANDLQLIASRLLSSNSSDVVLARKLLNFVPCLETEKSQLKQYRCASKWIRQNQNRLYYTGQSNQQLSNPKRYALRPETQTQSKRRHSHD